MRIYDIALFLFIFNLVLNLLSVMGLFDSSISSVQGFGQEELQSGQEQFQNVLSTNDKSIFSNLNWLIENVRLAIFGIKILITVIANATVLVPFFFTSLMCSVGGCVDNPSVQIFAFSIGLIIQFIYLMGLIQLITGKSFREAQ